MASRTQRRLIRLVLAVIAATVLGYAVVSGTTGLVTRWFQPEWKAARREAPDPEAVDAFLDASLPRIGATDVLGHEEEEGVANTTYRMPPGSQPLEAAKRLRALADARSIELYVSPEDGLDARVRVYAGASLRRQLLFVPTLPTTPPVARPRYPRERPLIALIVANLGASSARSVVEAGFPITVAVRPFTPFALRIAEDSALAWQEVLAHLPAAGSPLGQERSVADAVKAVPHATGLLLDEAPSPRHGAVKADLAAFPARYSTSRAPSELALLPAQRPGRAGARETLARTCHIAVRDGVAAMILDADAPELDQVLAWAATASDQGYRMVLASEAIRADELRGSVWKGVRSR